MKHLTNYHQLCEILNYDVYLVSVVISSFRCEISDDVFIKLQNLELEDYQSAIDEALDLPVAELKLLASTRVNFKSESSYIRYLKALLSLNDIEYIEYRERPKNVDELTGSLFDVADTVEEVEKSE